MRLTTPQSIAVTGAILMVASTALLEVLPPDKLMSVNSDSLSMFLRPGVIVWWLLLAEPLSYAPPSLGEMAFTAIANGALWLLALWFIVAIGRNLVTRWWFVLAAPLLATASVAALALLVSRETVPSAVRGPFSMFAEPGVSIWWLLHGGLFDYYPTSTVSIAFAAAANAAFWILLLGIGVATVRVARRLLKVPSP